MARTRWNWLVVLAVWAVAALVLLARAHGLAASTPLLGDTDDAMRLVQAMDLSAGQPWQDLTQHRDNAPFGASMHWSRLVDAPLAVLMVAATPLFGAAAPDVAAMAWPLLLLLGLLVLSAALVRKLVPEADMATGLMLPLLNLVLIVEFLPGRVDHHGVQILLSGATLLLLVGWRRRWWGGALAGLLVATSLAVGLETVLVAGVACLGMGLCWLGDPDRQRSGAIGFGLGLALGLAGHLWLATPAPALLQVACDMLSVVHVVAGTIGGLGLAASAAVASRLGWPVRLGLLGATGAAALAAVLLVAPRCLGGPYVDVPPDAFALMFPGIAEAQSLAQRLEFNLASGIGMAATTLAAVPLTLWIAWQKQSDARVDWLLVAAFLTVLAVLMLLQIRAARLAALFALPAGAWLITAARQRYLGGQSAGRALGLVAAWLSFATLAQYVVASAISAALPKPETGVALSYGVDPVSCLMPEAYEELAALPVGRVVAPIGISAHLLRHTPHAVLSAGFHRNVQSVRDEVAVFEGEETAARQVAVARELTYAVTCPGTSQYQGWSAPRGWDWLVEISQSGARLRIDRIVP